jgi:hypothetical protein
VPETIRGSLKLILFGPFASCRGFCEVIAEFFDSFADPFGKVERLGANWTGGAGAPSAPELGSFRLKYCAWR